MPLSLVLEQTTVRELSEACRQLAAAPQPQADGEMARLWREVASIPAAELERLLASEPPPDAAVTGDQEK